MINGTTLRWLGGRILQMVVVVWIVLTILFVFVRMSGDPALIIAGPSATPEILEQTRENLGLNDPLSTQYVSFLGDLVTLDFGKSFTTSEAALPVLLDAVPSSLSIALPALIISVSLAAFVGTFAALRNGSRSSRLVMLTSWIGNAMPFFVLSYFAILVFAINMGVLPATGGQGLESRVLPVAAIVIPQVATLSRLIRGQLLDVLNQPYVVAARSTGMSPRRVLLQALPNAVPPVISYLGVMMGFFLTMLVVVEPIFGYPGFGGVLIRGVTGRDFPIVQAAIFIVAVVIIGSNILADLANRMIDPQLREAK